MTIHRASWPCTAARRYNASHEDLLEYRSCISLRLRPDNSRTNRRSLAPTATTKSAAEIDREWQRSVSKYDAPRAAILREVDQQIAAGPYAADWGTLRHWGMPQWYKDAKFGIFIHWGVYSVPGGGKRVVSAQHVRQQKDAFHNSIEALRRPRRIRLQGSDSALPRRALSTLHEWAKLFKESGAQYVVPVAEHHDGFSMYDSGLSDWTVVKMGPKRDTLGELATAVRARRPALRRFSSHRAEHNFFYRRRARDPLRRERSQVRLALRPRASMDRAAGQAHGLMNDWTYVSEAWTRDWLARDTELVEKYKPEIVYFDWWIGQPNFRPRCHGVRRLLLQLRPRTTTPASSISRITRSTGRPALRDFERGQQDHIVADHWQTDTSISNHVLGLHRARYLQDTRVPGPPAHRHRQQERQSAAQLRPALRRHHSRRGALHAAADGRMAQGERRRHLRHHSLEDFRRGTHEGEARLPTTRKPSPTRQKIFGSPRRELPSTPSAWLGPPTATSSSTPLAPINKPKASPSPTSNSSAPPPSSTSTNLPTPWTSASPLPSRHKANSPSSSASPRRRSRASSELAGILRAFCEGWALAM